MKVKKNTPQNSEEGYIKVFRSILDWEWYDDISTFKVFMHLLVTVNWKDSKWRGIDIPRGSRITSFSKLAKETKLSVQNVRTAISHLESTQEITRSVTKNWQMITVENYERYQCCDSFPNIEPTSNSTISQHSTNTVLTTIEEEKEYIYINNNNIYNPENEVTPPPKKARKKKELAPPTLEEVKAYVQEKGYLTNPEEFYYFYDARGWKTKNGTIGNWKSQISYWELHRKPETTAEGRKREEYNIDF